MTPRLTRRAVLAGTVLPLLGCQPAQSAMDGSFAGMAHERGHLLRAPRVWPAPAVTHRVSVLVAGGGVAGLAAARALRQRGVDDFVLLELEDSAGGNSRGGSVQGIACPLGAHYLPLPGDSAREVQDLLEELGLRRRVSGRWRYAEEHLCHSPQERLFFNGQWQEGVLPLQGVSANTMAQYRRFGQRVAALQRAAAFSMPALRTRFAPEHAALDAVSFAHWLDTQGLDDPQLRWYLDYCCRDDYGAGLTVVSAWAGVHYFASRHGFHAPGEDGGGRDEAGREASGDAVLTWPEGNGWLTRQLAAPLGDRQRLAHTVVRIAEGRHGVEVDAFNHSTQALERWEAQRCIVALPVFVAARVVQNPPGFLSALAAVQQHAAWLVANVHLHEPLFDRSGAAPSWDNVVYGTAGLGYVDATHQRLDPRPGPTVLSFYRALGGQPEARRQLLAEPWTAWRDRIWAEHALPHPDLPEKATSMAITRYGHAMAIPTPGVWSQINALSKSGPFASTSGRLQFAHSDWSGYSVFEEAFTRGHLAGSVTASVLRSRRP